MQAEWEAFAEFERDALTLKRAPALGKKPESIRKHAGRVTAPRKTPDLRDVRWVATNPDAKVHRFFKPVIGRLQRLAGELASPQPDCISCIRSD